MSNHVHREKGLLLPIPANLDPQSEVSMFDELSVAALSKFLKNGLIKDSEAIENWVIKQSPIVAALPQLAKSDQLLLMEQIYDQYFGVSRHEGSTTSMIFGLGQVLAELSQELQLGTDLGEQDVNVLLDGLTAVLEVVNEC